MLFGKLLPREGNFFDLFNAHGEAIVAGSRSFLAMIQNYGDPMLREKYAAEVDAAEHAADKVTACTRPSSRRSTASRSMA
jgi:hypothetical protein